MLAQQIDAEVKKIVESALHDATRRTGVTLVEYVRSKSHVDPPRTGEHAPRPGPGPGAR